MDKHIGNEYALALDGYMREDIEKRKEDSWSEYNKYRCKRPFRSVL